MITSIDNTSHGYIVSVFLRDERGYGCWHSLRNFGDREGDAKQFAGEVERYAYPYESLLVLSKRFTKEVKYMRTGIMQYRKQQ